MTRWGLMLDAVPPEAEPIETPGELTVVAYPDPVSPDGRVLIELVEEAEWWMRL